MTVLFLLLQKLSRDFLIPGENTFPTQQSNPQQDQPHQIQPVQYEQPTTFRPNPYIHLQRQQQSVLPPQPQEAPQILHREDTEAGIYEQQKQQLAHQLLISRGLITNYNQPYQTIFTPAQQVVHVQHLPPNSAQQIVHQPTSHVQQNVAQQRIGQQHGGQTTHQSISSINQQPISTVQQNVGQPILQQQFVQQRADYNQFNNPNFYQHQYNEQQAYNQLLAQQRLYEEQQFRQSLSRNYNRFDLTPNNPTIHLFG